MKCIDCFFRDYSERRLGKYAELQVITWRCNIRRTIVLKLVKEKGKTIERFVDNVENCETYSPIAWEIEPFKRIME